MRRGTRSVTVEMLAGRWKPVHSLQAGEKVELGDTSYVFEQDRLEHRTSDQVLAHRIELRETQGVAEIDLHPSEPSGAAPTMGIAILAGDELQLCHALPGQRRPTSFSSTKENCYVLTYLRRVGVIL
ncbi:MAG: TIGR03067 domain-containing protein [Kofleriaceae bacterium]